MKVYHLLVILLGYRDAAATEVQDPTLTTPVLTIQGAAPVIPSGEFHSLVSHLPPPPPRTDTPPLPETMFPSLPPPPLEITETFPSDTLPPPPLPSTIKQAIDASAQAKAIDKIQAELKNRH